MSTKQVQQITNQLWEMANNLRGNMDASEFKNYILAFMFYRYLSERQEQYLIEQDLIVPQEEESFNDAYRREASGEDAQEYAEDLALSLGYAIAPEHTWTSLIESINQGEIVPKDYQDMFESFNANTEINKDATKDFRGLFNDINLGDSRLGSSTVARAKALNNIALLVDGVEYKTDSGKDILGDIYEYLIGQFAASAGKKGGEFYTPHEVSVVLARIVTHGIEASTKAYSLFDPTMGSGSLLLTVKQELPGGERFGALQFYGQELNTTTFNLARMNLLMRGVDYKNMTLRNADTLGPDWPDGEDAEGIDQPRYFDFVVANPPYSAHWDNNELKMKDPRFSDYGKLAPKTKADYAFVLHSLYHLNNEGRMAIVLPHGVLFRGAAEKKIRATLVDKNYLDAVIGLPPNLFYGTGIPTTILVFKKNKQTKDILFIDASNEYTKVRNKNVLDKEHIDKIIETYAKREDVDKYAHVADYDEILENDYNLNIPRYVDTFEEEEEIDIQEVLKDIAKDNQEIAELTREIEEQLRILGVEF